MGECCSNGNYPQERKIFDSFEKMDKNNIKAFNIINYDENYEKISEQYKNNFDKIGQFQYLRINFMKQLKRHILNENENYKTQNYHNFSLQSNYYRNNTYKYTMTKYNINGTQKTLYYIIILTLILKSYLKRKYISNELERSLLEISVVIMNKKYNNNDMKLILFYLSKMFEILFLNVNNIQNIINFKTYLSKINDIINDANILLKEEKYLFILTHIISLGEWFKNDYKSLLIDQYFRILLLKYYCYLFIQNYDFIVNNYSNYEKNIMINNNENENKYNENYYNENDLIQKNIDIIYNKKIDNLNKISRSIHYFFSICNEDIFTGKNIFNEFENILNQEIISNNLQNDINLIKYKKSIYHILFINILSINNNTALVLSFLDYIIEYRKLEIKNSDTYNQMIIKLYGKFNNNRIFLDKYSTIITNIFISEIEKSKNDKMIIDELYKYINDLNIQNKYTNIEEEKLKIKNYENIYFFIILFKKISFYFNKATNNRIIIDLLVYLNNIVCKIKREYKKNTININQYNNKYLYENINTTLKNFNNYRKDYFFNIEEKIPIALCTFLSSYILMINYIFQIDYKDITIDFDKSIIYIIINLEIKIIKYNKIKLLNNIITLLNFLIKHLNSKYINDYDEINNYLKNSLGLIINQAYKSTEVHINIPFTTLHLKIIYIIIILILININKTNSEKEILLSKNNKTLLKINQYNKIIGSYFQNLSDINTIQINNIQNLLQGQIYAITNISFIKIIKFIQNELFDDKHENENNINLNDTINFRARTLYIDDKNSDINIYINTKNNNLKYNTKTHLLIDNYKIKDSFSIYSNDTFSYRKINNKFIPYNTYNNDIISEKIIMPNKNNLINNDKINIKNNINIKEDIFSNRSSQSNFDIKI